MVLNEMGDDIRWLQHFENFCLALNQLKKSVEIKTPRGLSDLERLGVIKAFEFTHELARNVIK